ncbi:MAG: DNA/RNA non-specific endonuclease [Acetatifactor sp.]|nr:DNA/RNA non-specific endonuclease [Acetatifactor sp.]
MSLEYTNEICGEDKNLIKNYFDATGVDFDKYVIPLDHKYEHVLTEEEEKKLEEGKPLFSDLQEGRCGAALAYINKSTVTEGTRPRIKSAPSGFPTEEKYVDVILQRCHLIGCQLLKRRGKEEDDKDANLKRIFTGTRFMNNIMLYYEKQVAEYVDETDNCVLYRVPPCFGDANKLAYGVQIEAKFFDQGKEEDKEKSFNIFVCNKQPGIVLNYVTGEICPKESKDMINAMLEKESIYVLNKRKKRCHLKGCASLDYSNRTIGDDRKRDQLEKAKYHFCAICDLIPRRDVL